MNYITCNQKKNKPRISVAVCVKCSRKKNCPDYGNYLQPLLFPNLRKEKTVTPIYRMSSKPKRVESEVSEVLDRPEQLELNL